MDYEPPCARKLARNGRLDPVRRYHRNAVASEDDEKVVGRLSAVDLVEPPLHVNDLLAVLDLHERALEKAAPPLLSLWNLVAELAQLVALRLGLQVVDLIDRHRPARSEVPPREPAIAVVGSALLRVALHRRAAARMAANGRVARKARLTHPLTQTVLVPAVRARRREQRKSDLAGLLRLGRRLCDDDGRRHAIDKAVVSQRAEDDRDAPPGILVLRRPAPAVLPEIALFGNRLERVVRILDRLEHLGKEHLAFNPRSRIQRLWHEPPRLSLRVHDARRRHCRYAENAYHPCSHLSPFC